MVCIVLLAGGHLRWIGLTEPCYDCSCYLVDKDYLAACARVPWCMILPLAAIRCFAWKKALGWIIAILAIVFYFVNFSLAMQLLSYVLEIGAAVVEGGLEGLKKPEIVFDMKNFAVLFSGSVVSFVLFLKPTLLGRFKK